MKQSQYDNEFKREAIMLAEKAKEEGRSIASVASNLGISDLTPKKRTQFKQLFI